MEKRYVKIFDKKVTTFRREFIEDLCFIKDKVREIFFDKDDSLLEESQLLLKVNENEYINSQSFYKDISVENTDEENVKLVTYTKVRQAAKPTKVKSIVRAELRRNLWELISGKPRKFSRCIVSVTDFEIFTTEEKESMLSTSVKIEQDNIINPIVVIG